MVTDASLARNERGPYGRGRAGRPGDAVVAEKCPFCLWDLQKWWPHIRAPVFLGGPAHGAADGAEVREAISEVRLCHLKCAEESLDVRGGPGGGRGVKIEADFASSLRELLLRSPNLFARRAAARVSLEEERLQEVARSDEAPRWPFRELPAPPSATFAVEGIREMRLSASPQLLKLPSEIGFARSLDTLCLISNSLTELPPEVGLLTGLTHLYLNGNFLKTLPESVCALPKLQELCLDANKIEELPEITSAQLVLLTTPGNKMKEVRLVPQLQRLEVHGNQIRTIASLGSPVLHNLVTLKVMGNQLERLPEEVAYMTNLRILSVAQNRLKSLPEGISSLQGLEWLLAYGNCLTELSSNVMSGCRGLTRLLLEDNPLKPSTTAALIEAVPRSSVKTLGLDTQQVREALAASPSVCKEELPAAISVGTMLPVRGSSQISLKLTRASQLRRQAGVKSVAEPGGPVDPALQPAQLLIVAFAASQGEPEWLGFLRRLLEHGQVSPLPPACMSLSDLLEAQSAGDFDEKMSRFWHGSPCGAPEAEEEQDCECQVAQLLDFDVLTAIDHRMRWYAEDRPSLQEAFRELRPRYSKMLFVGASMGGFAALLHGGVLADGVLALNPQATLPEALLRPPAETPGDLQDLTQSLLDSAKAAADRGAQITVHSAADEHLVHASTLLFGKNALVIHPMQPRKPFARILDRANLLLPIVSDAVYRVLTGAEAGPVVTVGCWCRKGNLKRVRAEVSQLLKLFYGPGSGMLPRPGDWFCGQCKARNCKDRWFCWRCAPAGAMGSPITGPGTLRVMDSFSYPSRWDWGCTRCAAALCGYEHKCLHCGADRPDTWTS